MKFNIRVIGVLAVLFLASGVMDAQAGPFDTWGYRGKIRLAGYDRVSTLTNFPILVVLNSGISGFSYSDFHSLESGADLRFAASDGTTELPYEIEKWDASGNSYVWVKVPAVTGPSDFIYAYWGAPVAAPPCTTNGATWDAGFSGVWHMQSADAQDSTGFKNNGTAVGAVSSVAGKTGPGNAFDGTDYINVPATDLFRGSDDVTVEFWFNLASGSQEGYSDILDYDHATSPYQNFVVQLMDGVRSFSWAINNPGGWGPWNDNRMFALDVGVWKHVTLTKSGSTYTYYTDGATLLSGSMNPAINKAVKQLRFGAKVAGGGFLKGTIDEARISNAARSPDWIYATWLNQASNAAFLAFSDVVSTATSLTVRADAATDIDMTRATLNGTVIHPGAIGNPGIYICFDDADKGTSSTSQWAHVISLGADWGKGQSFSAEVTGLTPNGFYFYRCYAANSPDQAWSAPVRFRMSGEFVWTGAGADNNASTPGNWLQNENPTRATDSIRLDHASSKDMTWNLTNAVAAWTQTADYTGTVTIMTRFDSAFPRMEIKGNCQVLSGVWTHPVGSSGNTEIYRMRVDVGGDFTLAGETTINLKDKGFAANYYGGFGPGRNNTGANYESGACHGGLAGFAASPVPWSRVYGSITSPTNLGSSAQYGGGGALYLTVAGTATLNGTVTATSSYSDYLASAAGGSVYVIAGSFEGSGIIDCSGASNGGGGGGGGGGRIAIILTNSTSFGLVSLKAYGGRSGDRPDGCGAAGTIYRQTSAQASGCGTLTIDNNNMLTGPAMTMMTPAEWDLTHFAQVIITNRGFLAMNTNTVLDWVSQANMATYGPQQSLLMVQSTENISLSSDFSLTGFNLVLYTNLVVPGNFTLSNGGLTLVTDHRPGLSVGGNVSLSANSIMSHWQGEERFRLIGEIGGNLDIEAGSAVDADSKGFPGGAGPGRGDNGNANWTAAASHGGLSAAYPTPYAYWVTYGSPFTPTNFGSGGYRNGGGAIELHVAGATTLDGSLTARGMSYGLSGNAGGSVYLTTASLGGNGLIDASAGNSGQYGAGGGRIAVVLSSGDSFDDVVMRANGGNGLIGAPGTIYRQTASQGAGHGGLTIGGQSPPYTTTTVTPVVSQLGGTSGSDMKHVTLDGTANAYISLTNDLTMADLYLRSDSVRLQLNGHTLSLKARKHADWGTDARVAYDGGQILWTYAGTVIMVN